MRAGDVRWQDGRTFGMVYDAGPDARAPVELAWETMRAVLQGLALWWYEHPDVAHDRIVTSAMSAVDRVRPLLSGEHWQPRRARLE